jgi:hypothetical protein
MTIGTRSLIFASALVLLSACTTASPPDEDCITAGGVCFLSSDQAGCNGPLPNACASGYTCCATAYAANIVDGAVVDAPSGNPGSPDGEAGAEAGADATRDATSDASARDGTLTDSSDAAASDAADAVVSDGASSAADGLVTDAPTDGPADTSTSG